MKSIFRAIQIEEKRQSAAAREIHRICKECDQIDQLEKLWRPKFAESSEGRAEWETMSGDEQRAWFEVQIALIQDDSVRVPGQISPDLPSLHPDLHSPVLKKNLALIQDDSGRVPGLIDVAIKHIKHAAPVKGVRRASTCWKTETAGGADTPDASGDLYVQAAVRVAAQMVQFGKETLGVAFSGGGVRAASQVP